MAPEAVRTRRTFQSAWDEIAYLHGKVLYWLYDKGDRRKALPYAKRLKPLLRKASPKHEAIFGEECWSLIYEVERDFAKAIAHRRHEIEQILKLRKSSANKPLEQVALAGYGVADLSDRYDLLAILYRNAGDLDRAIEILQESRRLCVEHKVPFDGADLLKDYLTEKRQDAKNGRS